MVTLTLEHVDVRLGRRPVVRDVSAALIGGTLIGIVGPNGAGKSTLARALLALVPSTGRIRIDGVDVAAMPRAAVSPHACNQFANISYPDSLSTASG